MGHKRANQFRAAAANKEKLAIARIKRRQTQFITGIQNELLNRIFTDEVDPETGLKVAGPGILSLFEGREGFGQIGAAQQAALGRAQQASSRRIGELAQERGGLGGGFETAAQLQNFLQFGALRSQASEESARTRLQQEIGLTQGALGQASQFATGLQIQPISNIQQFSPGRSGVGGALGQLGGQIFGNLAADFFRGNTVFNQQPEGSTPIPIPGPRPAAGPGPDISLPMPSGAGAATGVAGVVGSAAGSLASLLGGNAGIGSAFGGLTGFFT